MAENLVHVGFEVILVEMLDQVLAPVDREIADLVEGHLTRHGVHLALNDGVAGFTQLDGGGLEVKTKSGTIYPADVVILALGVCPDTTLAKTAGLEIGERGEFASTSTCAPATPTFSPSATPSRLGTSEQTSGAWWRSQDLRTGRVGSQPM